MISVDSRTLCPPPERRDSLWAQRDFKVALAAQYGVDVGFDIYRAMLGLPDYGPLQEKRIAGLRDFAAQRAIFYREVYPPGQSYTVAPPTVIGAGERERLYGTARSFFVACLPDARVHNESLMIYAEHTPVLDVQGYELSRTDETLELVPYVFYASGDRVWMMPEEPGAVEIDEAFGSLLGRSSATFGHWLWEFLPKYLTALESGALPRDVPVLRRAHGMPQSMKDALEFLVPDGVRIIDAPPAPIRVKHLWCAPALMYSPYFEKLGPRFAGTGAQCFPPERFAPTLDAFARVARRAGAGPGIERLYLARKPDSLRRLRNAEAIEAIAVERGFTVVYPERLSFLDQVRLMQGARHVLGPEGSAMYLNFFARPQTKVCMFHNPFLDEVLTYTYLLRSAEIDVTVLTGDPWDFYDRTADSMLLYNVDYTIDPVAFAAFVETWLPH